MDIQAIIEEWRRDKEWIDTFTRDFPDLGTLADGIALNNVNKAPVVGDVTLANAIRQIPRSSVQQVPTLSAEINGTKLSVDAIMASFLLRRVVFNEDTFGNGILSTMQLSAQSALTYGFQPLMAQTGKIFNQFGTTLSAIHFNDVAIERGVFDASDSDHYSVRTRVTKSKLRRILKAAAGNPETKWNVEALKELIEMGPQAQEYNRLISPARQGAGMQDLSQFDIITRYGVGPYYDIVMYSPQLDKPLMEYKSRSKFGYPRVSFLVIDPAQLSPFGISRARLASPMANYGNIFLQSTAKMQLLNSDPPIAKTGQWTGATPLKRGVQWESIDPNAKIQLMELSNSTLQQFEPIMQFIGNQVLSVMGVSGTTANRPNSAYQNTAAIQQQTGLREQASTQVTAIIENALRQYALTALDLYISEQTGETLVIVDDEAKNAINQIEAPDPMTGAPFVGDDNAVRVNWEQYYDRIQTMTVTIDLSMAKKELDAEKRGDLQNQLTVEQQTADPNDPMARARINALSSELMRDVAPGAAKQVEASQPLNMQAVGGGEGFVSTPPMQ